MTAKQVFEHTLIELSKVKAPSLLLEDFNYLFNKAINNYINRRYGLYDTSLQTTDDLRVLKSTAILTPHVTSLYDKAGLTDATSDWTTSFLDDEGNLILNNLYGNINEVELPADYLHLLNCICIFKAKKPYKCYNSGSYVQFPAIRLDSDKWALIVNDYYNKPCYKRPYYFIHNVNTSVDDEESGTLATDLPTNPHIAFGGNDETSSVYSSDKLRCASLLLTVSSKITNSGNEDASGSFTILIGTSTSTDYIDCFNEIYIAHEDLPTINIYTTSTSTLDTTDGLNLVIDDIAKCSTLYIGTKGDGYEILSELFISSSLAGALSLLPGGVFKCTPSWSFTNKIDREVQGYGVDMNGIYSSTNTNLERSIDLFTITKDSRESRESSLIEKETATRVSNPSRVRMEIRYGKDNRTFELVKVFVDYIKSPQHIRLTPELMDLVEDTSQVMEFPDYVCQEITNELVMLVMENSADPRLQTNMAVNQSIAQPGQQQAAQAATSA